ncbi:MULTISPECIES: hypothetical protein [Nonomuraea]|uniref:Uncharacterized protein n=1 Tax=Nonomuraea mangrovi TaxID=2316207 RepID=A0ABW4T6F9_9ACTN
MNTKWFLLGDGTLISRSLQVDGSYPMKVTVPADAVEISEEKAAEIREGYAAGVRAWAAEQNAAADLIRRRDFDALVALGAPEETARRLSGYRGPAEAAGDG